MRSPEDIRELWTIRQKSAAPWMSRVREVRDAYNGDVVLPVPELQESERAAVANLVSVGLDQTAQRIGSTMPDARFAAVKPTKTAEKNAQIKRKAVFGWFQENRIRMKQYRRARHFIGYSCAPVIIRPDAHREIPFWHVRDPLMTFPAPGEDPDELVPQDCIFGYKRSLGWLIENYEPKIRNLYRRKTTGVNSLFDCIEYVDAEQITLLAVGHDRDPYEQSTAGHDELVVLEHMPNRAERPLAVIPGRITLDRRQGQFDNMIGIYQKQARLMALEEIAIERGIYPEQWLVSRPGEVAQIIAKADPIQGDVGLLQGGDLHETRPAPDFATLQAIDRYERAARITGGIPAEFGGESTTNVRTGKRGDAILSAVVDFPIQEAQEVFAAALEQEIKIGICIERAYFHAPKSFYVSWKGAVGQVDYSPAQLWDTDQVSVSYAHAGADTNGLVIGGGQRVGMGTLSKRGFMEIDPLIDDPEMEHDRVIAEALELALLNGIQTQAAQGAIPPADLARVMEIVSKDKMELAEAIQKVQEEAQARQASQAPPGSPETQPGLAQPGAGAEAGTAIPGPNPSQQGLAQLLGALRRPQMSLPAEQPQPA